MKAFLFLEHKFYKSGDKLYADKVVDYRFVEKYIEVFDEVCICARGVNQFMDNHMEPLSLNKQISFLRLPDCNSKGLLLSFSKIRRKILSVITDKDVAIFRAPSSISYVLYNSIRKLELPIAVELVADAEVFFAKEQGEHIIKRVIKRIGMCMLVNHAKELCSNANAVLYVTNMSLQKKYPLYNSHSAEYKRSFCVSCSDVILYDEYYSDAIANRTLDGELVICHMGAMNGDNKGQRVIIDIVNDINLKGRKCRAILIGDGTSLDSFKAYAREKHVEDKIEFTGQLNKFNSIKQYFSKSHIFVFPSQNEGLPRSVIEAMANSLPCVAYNVGGISELIDTDLLVKKNDYTELLNKVWTIANNESYRRRIARENYMKASEYRDCILKEKRHMFYQQFREIAEQIIQGEEL